MFRALRGSCSQAVDLAKRGDSAIATATRVKAFDADRRVRRDDTQSSDDGG